MVTFILKEPKGTGETLIYLSCYFSGRMMKFSTGHFITPAGWNKTKHRARKDAPRSALINAYLDKLEAKVKEIQLQILNKTGTVSPDKLRSELKIALSTGGKRETLIEWCERFIREKKACAETRKIYVTTLNHLKGFPGNKDFDDIDLGWLNRYVRYLEGKNMSANTIGKNITYLKIFLNEATEAKVNTNTGYLTRKFTKPSEEADTIFLTENELLHIYGVELKKEWDRIRDRFLIGAFTGLRFRDFSRVSERNIEGGMLTYTTSKTGAKVVIPLHWVVKQIIEKYADRGGLPPTVSSQKLSKYIKLIGESAGIKEVVVKWRTNGGVRTSQAEEKWKFISTHTARRSFATNAYLAGVPAISIMKITGHKTENSFLRYIRISQLQNAQLVSSNAFFAPPGI